MALNDNSYGSPDDVAALTPRWANSSGVFDGSTRPKLGTVQTWINQVSGMLNIALRDAGFEIPIMQEDALEAINAFVNEEVAARVEGINGAGRFGPTNKQLSKTGSFAVISADILAFIENFATGIEQLGATRTYSFAANIGYRGTDEDGNSIEPMFQRSAFGNQVIGA